MKCKSKNSKTHNPHQNHNKYREELLIGTAIELNLDLIKLKRTIIKSNRPVESERVMVTHQSAIVFVLNLKKYTLILIVKIAYIKI